jgi:hypothetical protein
MVDFPASVARQVRDFRKIWLILSILDLLRKPIILKIYYSICDKIIKYRVDSNQ